ncbi:MAG: hypothetical protein HZB26_13135 [Candidatus Hydrogenedentes bacterium]|nr:hypothetical protein [Candidatus Hydrogenedentota bacterium]
MPNFYEHLDTLFAWVLRSTAQASVLAILILAIQFLLRKRLPARWQYALWLVLLIRIALPWAPESPLSIFNVTGAVRLSQMTSPLAAPTTIQTQDSLKFNTPLSAPPASSSTPSTDAPAAPPASSSLRSLSSLKSLSTTRIPWPPPHSLPALAWAFGAISLALYAAARNIALWTHIRRQRPVTDPEQLNLLEECKERMGVRAPVSLVESSRLGAPALVGFIRPRLVLPVGSAQTLSPEELHFIFLHELAHLKRADILVNWIMLALQVLHWFNPIIWMAFRRMLADREAACDALALSRAGAEHAHSYGLTILRLLDRTPRLAIIPGAAGILEDKSQLKRRITLIAQFTPSAYRWSLGALALIAVIALVGLTNPARAADPASSAPDAIGAAITPAPSTPVPAPPVSRAANDTIQYNCEFVVLRPAADTPLPDKDIVPLPDGNNLADAAGKVIPGGHYPVRRSQHSVPKESAPKKSSGDESSSEPGWHLRGDVQILSSPTVTTLKGKPAKIRIGQRVPVSRFESKDHDNVKLETQLREVGLDLTVTVAPEEAGDLIGLDLNIQLSRELPLRVGDDARPNSGPNAIESRSVDGHYSVKPNAGYLMVFRPETVGAILVAVRVSPRQNQLGQEPNPKPTPQASVGNNPAHADTPHTPSDSVQLRIADAEARKKAIERKLNELASTREPVTPEAKTMQQSLDTQVKLAEDDLARVKKMHQEGLASDYEIEKTEAKVQQERAKAAENKLAPQKELAAAQAPLKQQLDAVEIELEGLRTQLTESAHAAENTDPVIVRGRGAMGVCVAPDGKIYYADYFGNSVGALDLESGTMTDLVKDLKAPSATAVIGDKVVFTESGSENEKFKDGTIRILDPASGAVDTI